MSPRPDETAALRDAFVEASNYAAALARPARAAELAAGIATDLATGTIEVDPRGLTPGALATMVKPAGDRLRQWQALRAVFMARLEPKRADLEAAEALPAQIADLQHKRLGEIDLLRQRWADNPRNALIAQQWEVAQTVHQQESLRHGQRLANTAAYSPFYWAGLLLIGVAEWLINYDTFLIFTGVVAIAAGATAILAVLLAFAAHGHGELLKQWSYRFGRFQTRQNRVGSWRMLGLSSIAVLVVLAAAGGSRYAAVLRSMGQAQAPDIIGGGYQLAYNPSRDVLLSLLANVAAWIVGVFIAYFCHDVDPDFMAATWQHRRGGAAYFRARRHLEEETRVLQARTTREAAAIEASAASRRHATEAERGMLIQINQHDMALTDTLLAQLRSDLARYRAELLRQAASYARTVRFAQRHAQAGPEIMTAEQFAAAPITVDRALLDTAR